MMEALNPILQWLNQHPNWACLATFIIAAGESIAIIGTIVPGTVMMTAIGTLAGAAVIPLIPTLICAILGAVVGDGISYMLGHHFKDRIRLIWPFRNNPSWLEKGESFCHRHGGKSVFIGRFVGPVRAIVPVIAGMLGMKPIKFYIANILSAIGWAPAYMLPGIILGAVSLELPPDIAVHVILMLLLVILFIVFVVWTVYKIFFHIGYRIDRALNALWNKLKNSHYAHVITTLLKHHNPHKTHGQLVLAFYLIVVVICLAGLAHYIAAHSSSTIFLNYALYHFFRSLRSPGADNAALFITLLGENRVILPIITILFGWLLFTKRNYLAWHVLVLGLLATISISVIKPLVHSARPWGIPLSSDSFSFPSGHATLATIFYIGLALLIGQIYPSKRKQLIFSAIIIALVVSLSRLYLGAHWFTDVVAGWLLGSALIMLVTISYNRQKNPRHDFGKIAAFTFLVFICVYSFTCLHYFYRFQQQYTVIDYPARTTSIDKWWQQSDTHAPIFRINRIGLASQVLNLQWIGNLTDIEKTLLQNGWQHPPERNWISVLLRITDVQSSEYLPLVSPLHHDKKPALVLIKHTQDNKQVMVIRLWDSNIIVAPRTETLWVGTVSLIPRTYNWLFKKKSEEVANTPDIIFPTQTPEQYDMMTITLSPTAIHRKYKLSPAILLLKPKF